MTNATTSPALARGTDSEIRRFTGEFMSPVLERRYRLDMLVTNRRTYWKLTVLMACGLPLFSLVDLNTLGIGVPWAALLLTRCISAALILLTGRRVRDTPESFVEPSGRLVLTGAQLAVFASAIAACALRPEDATTNALSVTVLMLAALVMVPGRFRDQIASAVALLAALVAVSVLRFHDPALPLVPLIANLVVALAWGALVLSFNNRSQRRQWASTQRELATAARLNDELDVADRLRSELQLLARQDPLTTAANRREFLRVATRAMEDRRNGGRVSMLLLDVDRFKSVNDRFGHAAGDVALVWLVAVIRESLRDLDLVARIGGEEFAVLLPDLDLAAAGYAAERLRNAVATCEDPAGLPEPLTVSIGVAESRRGETVESLMARADTDMYRAKRNGGNAVGLALDDPSVANAGT